MSPPPTNPPSHEHDDATDDGPSGDLPAAIGSYRVRGRLGEGGMGEVFECYDPRLMRVVAVKRVRLDRAASPKTRARFWREARALAAIDHPGVVKVFEIGETPDGSLFLAMQRVAGEPLSSRLGDGPWPWSEALALGRHLADVLMAVHASGVVHRDLKPSNVLVLADGSPVLVDFGIATGNELEGGALTETGQVVGTASYMAPEQLEGRPDIGPAADVFAWGILVYRLISGRHPFARTTREQTAMALAAGTYPPLGPQAPDAPAGLVALIERCLAVRPEARPADGPALVAALAELDGGAPRPSSREVARPRTAGGPVTTEPTELPAVVVPGAPPPARGKWLALLSIALATIAVVAFVLTRGDAEPDVADDTPTTPPTTSTTTTGTSGATPGLRPLPPRPTVAVLAPEGADPTFGAVLAETLRIDLGERPSDVRVLPAVALDSRPADRRMVDVDVAVSSAVDNGVITLTATDTRDGRVRWSGSAPLGDDATTTARTLAKGLWAALELEPLTAPPPLTTTLATFGDTLAARAAARDGDTARARSLLTTALKTDPDFVPARVEELALLRTERRMDELATAAAALLARKDLPQHDAAFASAWLALAQDDPTTFVRRMYEVIAGWPYDIVAYESLLAVLFLDGRVADLAEAGRIAEQALAVAPATQTIASRFVRALGFRGLGATTEAKLRSLGVPLDAWVGLRAELALYDGKLEAAIAGFDAWAREAPEHVYAVNMGIAARILADRPAEAAQLAMARIQAIEARGVDTNLSWSYSLAAQALASAERWDAARALLARWADKHPEDAEQVRWFTLAFELGRTPDADLAARIAAEIAHDTNAGRAPAGVACTWLALLATTPEPLAPCRAEAEARSFDLGTPTHARTQWTRIARLVEARDALMRGDREAAIRLHEALVFPLAEVRHETDLGQRVTALFALARALDALGESSAARVHWQAIIDAGYARLYQSPLYLAARRALARPP